MPTRTIRSSFGITLGGEYREVPATMADIYARASEVLAGVQLVKAQADALLAAAENAVAVPVMKDADAASCEVALDGVKSALQAIARGFGAVRIAPAYDALIRAQATERFETAERSRKESEG